MRRTPVRRVKAASLEPDIVPIGTVHTQPGHESVLDIDSRLVEGLHGIAAGDHLLVLYWMHGLQSHDRKTLRVHPQGDRSRPLKGVFGLRSPMRPNPIGVSTVCVTRVERNHVFVSGLDALDGSPILDIKGRAGRSGRGIGGSHEFIYRDHHCVR